MGMYITWTDVANRYPNISNRGDMTEGQNFYVVGAEAEVNAAASYLYSVPFLPVASGGYGIPDLIKDVAVDLTYWKAIGWNNEKLSDVLRKNIDRRLDGIKDGSLRLVGSGGVLLQNAGPAFAYSSTQELGNPRTFMGLDDPTKWSVPQSVSDTLSDQRDSDP